MESTDSNALIDALNKKRKEVTTPKGDIKMQHIVKLEAVNVKRLTAATISPDGNMIVIGGENGAGKSSVLDCIEYALGGKRRLPQVPIHRGADRGHIILETEKYTIKRTFTEKGDYIEVKTAEGYTIGTPQALLDQLVGDLSFDPLAFTRLDPKKQLQMLMRILDLDFSELDEKYAQIEATRRDIGRDGKAVKARLDSIPLDADAPDAEVVINDVMIELNDALRTNGDNAMTRSKCEQSRSRVDSANSSIAYLEQQLAEAKAELGTARAEYTELSQTVETLVDVDVETLRAKANNAEEHNKRFRTAQERKALSAEYEQAKGSYEKMTEEMRKIEADKSAQIAAANFPVEGVSFGADGVLVNGLPFEQASSAEQLKIAVAMGLSTNPELRVVLIRDGSLLDENSLAAVSEMAGRYDAQVWMERVGVGQEVSVIIENGQVSEDRTTAANEVAA